MTAARKTQREIDPVTAPDVQRSGEHAIDLDAQVRRAFERAFGDESQSTKEMTRFDLEEVLKSPEAKPTDPPPIVGMPIVNVVADDYEAISVGSLPPPAIEVDRTKEDEERDP